MTTPRLTVFGRRFVLVLLAFAVALTYCFRANCEARWQSHLEKINHV